MYKPVAEAAKAKDAKKIADTAQPLIAKHPGSFYASEAALIVAKSAFDFGKRVIRELLHENPEQHARWTKDITDGERTIYSVALV